MWFLKCLIFFFYFFPLPTCATDVKAYTILWHPTPVLLPRKSHGQRSLVGCSPRGALESDTTERLHFHFSLSCIGEGNGNPLQCSCLENPRDGEAWWAAVYEVTESPTRLKRLSNQRAQEGKNQKSQGIRPKWDDGMRKRSHEGHQANSVRQS